MHLASYFFSKEEKFEMKDSGILDLKPWKYAKPFSLFLVLFTVVLYIILGNV
jgi:SSS family solute:Na+ symporter